MKRFKYSVEKLIEGVRDRPCLWNKFTENYKDRVERKMAWKEICNILDERYEEMTSDDKRLTSEMIIAKWTNVRDTFVKSLRNKAGRPKKQYVLYDHLKFLLQILPEAGQQEQDNLGYITDEQPVFMKDELQEKETTSTSFNNESVEYEINYEDSDASSDANVPVYKASSSKRKRSKKESRVEVEDSNIDFVSIDDPRIMNEDEAFFASLLPTVVKYDEDERLEFRIEVLALMKRIKDKRKWSSDVVVGQP